jgi:transcriptional regulator with XRE-family HTH domain
MIKKHPLVIEVGELIRELRKKNTSLSQERFALEHDIDRTQYGKIERGEHDIGLSTLINVLDKHNMDLSTFFKLLDKKLAKKSPAKKRQLPKSK